MTDVCRKMRHELIRKSQIKYAVKATGMKDEYEMSLKNETKVEKRGLSQNGLKYEHYLRSNSESDFIHRIITNFYEF